MGAAADQASLDEDGHDGEDEEREDGDGGEDDDADIFPEATPEDFTAAELRKLVCGEYELYLDSFRIMYVG